MTDLPPPDAPPRPSRNPFRIAGYEKFWVALLGGTMTTAVTTFVLWGASSLVDQANAPLIPTPDSDAVVAAITGVVTTVFTAALVYLTATTKPVDEPVQPPVETAAGVARWIDVRTADARYEVQEDSVSGAKRYRLVGETEWKAGEPPR